MVQGYNQMNTFYDKVKPKTWEAEEREKNL